MTTTTVTAAASTIIVGDGPGPGGWIIQTGGAQAEGGIELEAR
jgi:hypothetical protein